VQPDGPVRPDAVLAHTVRRERHVDRALNRGADAPQRRRRIVADDGAAAAREDRRERASVWCGRFVAPEVDAAMNRVQRAALQAVGDLPPPQSERDELVPRDDAVLAGRDERDELIGMHN
jgi:hypothetical protein